MQIRTLTLAAIAILLSINSFSQQKSLKDEAVRVFLDCNGCDTEHIKKELNFVNYMRDRNDAQVHILSTRETNGAGGVSHTFFFIGQKEFSTQADTLSFSLPADATPDETRTKQENTIKLGLVRYMAKTPYANLINISIDGLNEEDSEVTDKWNSWVFELEASTFFDAEQSYKYFSSSTSIGAQRVTENLKIEIEADYYFSKDQYIFDDTTIYSTTNEKEFEHLLVKSINNHWSVGYSADIESSLYENYSLNLKLYPAIEYNLFPYTESNRKQLRFLYAAGVRHFNYIDSTIYNKTEETLLGHELGIAAQFKQKWGTINISLEGSNYFHNFSFNRLRFNAHLNLRIYKGLSLTIYGGAQLVHDQLNLPKGDVSSEDVLLRRKELASQYNYWGSVGLTYSFGSIYNNVVNPRFGN